MGPAADLASSAFNRMENTWTQFYVTGVRSWFSSKLSGGHTENDIDRVRISVLAGGDGSAPVGVVYYDDVVFQ